MTRTENTALEPHSDTVVAIDDAESPNFIEDGARQNVPCEAAAPTAPARGLESKTGSSQTEPRNAEARNAEAAAAKFSKIVVAICGVAFATIAIANYLVDPYAQYASQLLPPLVQTSRAQKLELLHELAEPPDGLILGSSRVLKLEPDYLEAVTGLQFFNSGVNYGKPEDFLAFLRLYQSSYSRAPKMVVLGVDVHGFSPAIRTDARLLSSRMLAKQVSDIVPWGDRIQPLKELLSWQQTKMSAKSVIRFVRGRGTESEEPAESFRHDGMIIYHHREQQLADGSYDFGAAIQYNQEEYRQLFQGFDRLSEKRCDAIRKLAKFCQEHGTELIVFLTPMHPDLAESLSETSYADRKRDVGAFLNQVSDSYSFSWSDLSEVTSFDGDEKRFVDGIHPLEENTRRMIDRCFEPLPPSSSKSMIRDNAREAADAI